MAAFPVVRDKGLWAACGKPHCNAHPKPRPRCAGYQGHRRTRPRTWRAFFKACHLSSTPAVPSSARAFIAGGLPRVGVSVKPQPGQQWRWCPHTVFHAVQTTAPLAAQSTHRHSRPYAKAASPPSLLDLLNQTCQSPMGHAGLASQAVSANKGSPCLFGATQAAALLIDSIVEQQ